MQISKITEKNTTIVSLLGRMDATTSIDFENECKALVQENSKNLLIDMGGLEYISSAGLRSILTIVKLIKQEKGKIGFCELQTMVEEVFKVSGFTSMLKVFQAKNEALIYMNEE